MNAHTPTWTGTRGALAVLVALAALVAALAAPAASATDGDEEEAGDSQVVSDIVWAFADRPNAANYVVDNDRWHNPAGSAPEVTRSDPGQYRITFPGQSLNDGNATVTSMKPGVNCNVGGWGGSLILANCYDLAGNPTNAPVSVRWTNATDEAWVWASQPTSANYSPTGSYVNNPGGGSVDITRTSPGIYGITFNSLGLTGGNPIVTAYNSAALCRTQGWSSSSVSVRCFDDAGNLVDSRWALAFSDNGGDAWMWHSDPANPAYTPGDFYSNHPDGGTLNVIRQSTGKYRITFANLNAGRGNIQVTPYVEGATCAARWGNSTALVFCHDFDGDPMDARLALRWTHGPADRCAGKVVTRNLSIGQNGTAGPDVILGTPGPNTINARAGNDTVCAGRGDDTVMGGDGADVLQGGPGQDDLFGGGGPDRIFGQAHADNIEGRLGNDLIRGGNGTDILRGQGGKDRIYGGNHRDTIAGGRHDDQLNGGAGPDVIRGGPGHDLVVGAPGNDELYGGDHADNLQGHKGADILRGQRGNDRLNGNDGADTLYGAGGPDMLIGGAHNDVVHGGAGDDVLEGRGGNDKLYGNRHDDTVRGGPGTDVCGGGPGTDTRSSCETSFGFP